jgi:gluconokinase
MKPASPRIVLLMGVAGCGKTTVGKLLANQLGWPYFEADDFHSVANKEKMARGTPLNDDDRAPWLASIRTRIDECVTAGQSAVFTCSALKEKYREVLMQGAPVKLIHLVGNAATIESRITQRESHYMKANMLQSQFATLEVPADALTLDIRETPEALVKTIRQECGLARPL